MRDSTTEYLQLVEDCTARDSRLTDWDRTFLDSIFNQLAARGSLSPKQSEKLDEIWERVTALG
jgi:hypothetical protein